MKVEIQVAIPGVPYSVNKQSFDTDGMTPQEINERIMSAKAVSNSVVEAFAEIDPVTRQLKSEYDAIKLMLEKQQVSGEQKSLFIAKLKEAVGEEEYDRIRDEVMASADYAKITAHASWVKGQ